MSTKEWGSDDRNTAANYGTAIARILQAGATVMTDINISFCRALLKAIVPEVREAGKKPHKDAWLDRKQEQPQ